MKTILVTGGDGFIGSRVTEQLLNQGYAVVVLDDQSSASFYSKRNRGRNNIYFYKDDLCKPGVFEKIQSNHGIDGVIHLAAKHYIPFCNENPDITKQQNIEGTRAVHMLAEEHGVPLVFASSAAVYCNENNISAPAAEYLTSAQADVYSYTKIQNEKLLQNASYPKAVLRFFNVYGAFDPHEHLVPKLVHNLVDGSNEIQLGSKDSVRDYVYVDDVATAVISAMEYIYTTGESLTTDIASGENRSVAELVDELHRVYIETCTDRNAFPIVRFHNPEYSRKKEIKTLKPEKFNLPKLEDLARLPKTTLKEGLDKTLKFELAYSDA